MIDDDRSTDAPAASAPPQAEAAYDAPALTTLGDAVELTTGSVLNRDESPAGTQA